MRAPHAAVLVVLREHGDERLDDLERARAVVGASERVVDVHAREREVVDVGDADVGRTVVGRVTEQRRRRRVRISDAAPRSPHQTARHTPQQPSPCAQPRTPLVRCSLVHMTDRRLAIEAWESLFRAQHEVFGEISGDFERRGAEPGGVRRAAHRDARRGHDRAAARCHREHAHQPAERLAPRRPDGRARAASRSAPIPTTVAARWCARPTTGAAAFRVLALGARHVRSPSGCRCSATTSSRQLPRARPRSSRERTSRADAEAARHGRRRAALDSGRAARAASATRGRARRRGTRATTSSGP